MLKADLVNSNSNGVVWFILYPSCFLLYSFNVPYSLFLSPLRALQLQSDPEGTRVTLGRAVKVFMTVVVPSPSAWNDITVIAAVRDPQYCAPYAFYGFIYCVL